jgi:hypothetical protein
MPPSMHRFLSVQTARTEADEIAPQPVSASRRAHSELAQRWLEAGVVAALTALAAAAYVWTKAPLYNPRGSIDPWLYTALWTNFDQMYHLMLGTYYASRIPWILPGYVLNGFLDPRTASLVLHGALFLSGGVALYLLCRRFFGWIPAAIAYAGLIGSQMYFDAHRWDYQEGAIVTLLIATVYFATPLTTRQLIRVAFLALSGFTSAALVTTQLFSVVFLVGLPLMYLVVLVAKFQEGRLRQFGIDLGAYAVGGFILVVACGVFAVAHGGRFFFFMPQVRSAFSIQREASKQPLDIWLHREPRFFVPLFVVAVAVTVLVARRTERLQRHALAAATIWAAVVFGVLAVWEFASDGYFFDYVWYFSPFLPPLLICLAGVAATLVSEWNRITASVVLVVGTAAVAAPLLWIYREDLQSRVADDVGREQYQVMFIAMCLAALATVAALSVPRLRNWIGIGAIALSFFATSYGLDASLGTYVDGASDPRTGQLYDLGQDLVSHLRRTGLGKAMPYFWYDGQNNVYSAIQSLYYYSFSYVGTGMPKIDEDFRARMDLFKPRRLVLLCESVHCGGSSRALARAGYKPRLESRTRLAEGPLATWVEIYRVTYPPRA